MENFRNFSRDKEGSWTCMEPATLDLPTGSVQVPAGTRFTLGTPFMGVDVAAQLEAVLGTYQDSVNPR